MTERTHLIEQHILEYESRLKHMDEIIAESNSRLGTEKSSLETSQLLESLAGDRETIENHMESLKSKDDTKAVEEMIAKFSPLNIWDTVAWKLEKLAERLDK